MRKSTTGFTIIELIVVIVVLGIIAAIVIVSYTAIQKATLNQQRGTELLGWKASFEKYKAANGQYPAMANGGYCLGTGFPDGKCRNYTAATNVYYESNSTALMSALAAYSPPAAGTRTPVINTSIGPYVDYYTTSVQLTTAMDGSNEADCPQGSTKSFQNTEGTRMLCNFTLPR